MKEMHGIWTGGILWSNRNGSPFVRHKVTFNRNGKSINFDSNISFQAFAVTSFDDDAANISTAGTGNEALWNKCIKKTDLIYEYAVVVVYAFHCKC